MYSELMLALLYAIIAPLSMTDDESWAAFYALRDMESEGLL